MSGPLATAFALFLVMGLGAISSRLGWFGAETRKGVAAFVANAGFPAAILVSMRRAFDRSLADEIVAMLSIGTACYLASIALAFLLIRSRKAGPTTLGAWRFAFCFPNVGFMGYPVASALFGPDSLFLAAVFNMPFQFLAFSVGARMISGGGNRGEATNPEGAGLPAAPGSRCGRSLLGALSVLANTNVVAASLGFLLFFLSARIPEPFSSALELVGSSTTPLSMIVIGATLASSDWKKAFRAKEIWLLSAWRLVAFPALLYLALSALGAKGTTLRLPVTLMAMPVAANSTILAQANGGDSETASALVAASTALSIAGIAALAALFGTA